MKKLLLLLFVMVTCGAYAQTIQTNGTIYKEHPYITIVNHSNDMFLAQDWDGLAKIYADTVKFYDPTTVKSYGLDTAKKHWASLTTRWEKITSVTQGYPDGLKYDKDPFTVQSWWIVTAVNKKTQKTAKFYMVQFDTFNKDGKIDTEVDYYDPTSLIAATK